MKPSAHRIQAAAVAATLALTAGMPAASAAATDTLLGDVDKDLHITVKDVSALQRLLLFDVAFDRAADVDDDGKVTIEDATILQRWLAEFAVPYPIGEPVPEINDEKNAALNALKARYDDARSGVPDDAPVLMRSYDTERVELSNTAYIYDNAVAAMAFISAGEQSYAKSILDAFVYAQSHDRFQNGLLRNAYAAGNIRLVYDGKETAALPGWYSYGWCEDRSQVGCSVGNTAYAVLAMLQYDAAYGSDRYLETAKTLMDRVLNTYTDGGDGFTAGFDGWPEQENQATVHRYKSTEHNIDAYAAFKGLYAATGDERYRDAADSALRFVQSMYSSERGLFYTGTDNDGNINASVVVLDAQVWNAMALQERFAPYEAALDLVVSMKLADGGYPFCQENKNGGWWPEGTAFTALLFRERGDAKKYADAMDALCSVQLANGMFPSATVDNLSTGIYLAENLPWEYNTDPHVAPTAWFVMAANRLNPYTIG